MLVHFRTVQMLLSLQCQRLEHKFYNPLLDCNVNKLINHYNGIRKWMFGCVCFFYRKFHDKGKYYPWKSFFRKIVFSFVSWFIVGDFFFARRGSYYSQSKLVSFSPRKAFSLIFSVGKSKNNFSKAVFSQTNRYRLRGLGFSKKFLYIPNWKKYTANCIYDLQRDEYGFIEGKVT